MDIVIRKINPKFIKFYDEKAKEKNLSREGYLRMLIENMSFLDRENEVEKRYKELIEKMLNSLNINSKIIEENTQMLNNILELLSE